MVGRAALDAIEAKVAVGWAKGLNTGAGGSAAWYPNDTRGMRVRNRCATLRRMHIVDRAWGGRRRGVPWHWSGWGR